MSCRFRARDGSARGAPGISRLSLSYIRRIRGWAAENRGRRKKLFYFFRSVVVILAVCTLVVAVVSIGLVITESNMSVHRHQLASACENAVMEMGQARERLNEHVDARLKSIDTRSLTARQKREYESLRQVDKTVSIDCDAGQRNSRLEENARKAEQEAVAEGAFRGGREGDEGVYLFEDAFHTVVFAMFVQK